MEALHAVCKGPLPYKVSYRRVNGLSDVSEKVWFLQKAPNRVTLFVHLLCTGAADVRLPAAANAVLFWAPVYLSSAPTIGATFLAP